MTRAMPGAAESGQKGGECGAGATGEGSTGGVDTTGDGRVQPGHTRYRYPGVDDRPAALRPSIEAENPAIARSGGGKL